MKTALVTGATSGIGLAIVRKLLKLNYKVYGVGRDFSKIDIKSDNFYEIECDLSKYQNIELMVKKYKFNDIDLLINSAGIGYFGPHEEVSAIKIHKMVSVNLEAALILIQLLLRNIKKNKGNIINISSITAQKSSTYGLAYSATKSGLSHFSKGLFDEVRKYGVGVTCIHPDITKTNFYDNANFTTSDDELGYILPECVADAVENILSQRLGTVISEITIQPQKHLINKK